ncbi:MAG TPA: hypothetical protein PK530_21615, partial [Anaerolineales bacterium]|nr:hypothetical protein [Anaerolineales bacterium]
PQAPALRQQEALLPPIFSAPPPVTAPAPILPYEETPTPEAPRFQPLVDETQTSPADDLEPEWELTENSRPHSVHDLIERLALPKNSLILGVCEDGLPLVLELSDPSPGALLFLGDEVEGMQKHLQAILSSICLMSDPKQVQVDIITPSPKTFAPQKMYPHVQKTHLPDQDEMYELLGNLFGLVEQRQRKDNSLAGKWLRDFLPLNKGPVRVLVIDQVDVLVEQLAPESLAYLRWLLRRGPAANVWVLASLNTRNAQCLDGKTLKAFGLRISGKIQNPGQASRLTDVPAEKLSSLISGEQACLKLDEEIVEFSILE